MGKILQPAMDAEICYPTIGSGGLAINMRNYVEARYGTAKHLTIHGQELKDGIYKMCVMNMISQYPQRGHSPGRYDSRSKTGGKWTTAQIRHRGSQSAE